MLTHKEQRMLTRDTRTASLSTHKMRTEARVAPTPTSPSTLTNTPVGQHLTNSTQNSGAPSNVFDQARAVVLPLSLSRAGQRVTRGL